MLKAANKQTNSFVLGWDAQKGPDYACPECHEDVVLKKGEKVVHHFAHARGTACPYGTGESRRHMEMKKILGKFFCDYCSRVDYEVKVIEDRRADLVLYGCRGWNGDPVDTVVVECQASNIAADEVERRTMDYEDAGIPVIWFWDTTLIHKKYGVKYMLAEDRESRYEYRIRSPIRAAARSMRGVYALDHWGRAWFLELDDGSWRNNGWGSYLPETKKFVTPRKIKSILYGEDGTEAIKPLGPRQESLL